MKNSSVQRASRYTAVVPVLPNCCGTDEVH
jgi:hypothetical protein